MINRKLIKPSILAIATYLLSYQIPKLIINEKNIHFIKISLDDRIPLIKPFVIIYLLAFVQWSIFMLVLVRQDTHFGYKYTSAILIGSIVGFIIFISYPTGTQRPEIIGNGFFDNLIIIVYSTDSTINAIPSFHCFCSWICFRGLMEAKGIDRKWIIINFLFSILVFVSTIFTKQHFIIDIPTGILLAEISIQIASKHQFTKLFNMLNKIGR